MPVELQQILDEAEKLGKLIAEHPAVARYKEAQRAVTSDPDAGRMVAEFDRLVESLGRQEQMGHPVTDAQRTQLESLQSKIVSHLKIKALNMAHVDFVDVLRKVTDKVQGPSRASAQAPAPPSPRR